LEASAVLQHPIVSGLYSGGEIELIAVVKNEDLAVLHPLEVPLEPLPVCNLTRHLLRELDPAGGVHVLTANEQPAPQFEQDTGLASTGFPDESYSPRTVGMPVEHGVEVRLDGLRDLVGVEGVVVWTHTTIPVLLALLVLHSHWLCCFTALMASVTHVSLHLPAVGKLSDLGLKGLITGLAGDLLGVRRLDFYV
jgi:hypothetical protein